MRDFWFAGFGWGWADLRVEGWDLRDRNIDSGILCPVAMWNGGGGLRVGQGNVYSGWYETTWGNEYYLASMNNYFVGFKRCREK